MIPSPSLKKTLLISLIGHLAILNIFTFSFGKRLPLAEYSAVAFWGSILGSSDLMRSYSGRTPDAKEIIFKKTELLPIKKLEKTPFSTPHYYLKPAVIAMSGEEKMPVKDNSVLAISAPAKKESVIMFYPQLPQHFLFFFKDRQAVHIELKFNISPTGNRNSAEIKRKISSGNLEADLLTLRYIDHYLFIEQARFVPNNWQTVKIDLSAKERN